MVRQIDAYEDGCKSYLVKSPCQKLYQFNHVENSPEDLIKLIEEGMAEGEIFESLYQNIYDVNTNNF